MKYLLSFFLISAFAFDCYAQPKVPDSYFEEQLDTLLLRKYNLFFEGGGSSMIFGLNFEILKNVKDHNYFAFKMGLTYIPNLWKIPYIQSGLIATPAFSYFWGKTDQKIETGAFTAINLKGQIVPGLILGLRDCRPNKVLLRLNFTPIIGQDGFRPFIGVSLGKNFGPKPKMANEEMIELLEKMKKEQMNKTN